MDNFSIHSGETKDDLKKIRCGKDGRIITPRKEASAREGFKQQLWSVTDLDLAFDLWEANKNKPPKEKLSKLAISKQIGIPYTTVCERLSGCHGGVRRGKIVGEKCQLKVLDEGKQTGNIWNCNRTQVGNQLPT